MFVCFCAVSLYAESFKGVEYLHPENNGRHRHNGMAVGTLSIENNRVIRDFYKKNLLIAIPTASVTDLLYERTSTPRYAAGLLIAWPLLFTKSKQHYLTVQYSEDGKGKYAIFKMDKNVYRDVLAALESSTGKRVEWHEE